MFTGLMVFGIGNVCGWDGSRVFVRVGEIGHKCLSEWVSLVMCVCIRLGGIGHKCLLGCVRLVKSLYWSMWAWLRVCTGEVGGLVDKFGLRNNFTNFSQLRIIMI